MGRDLERARGSLTPNETTTAHKRVEVPDDVVARTAQLARQYAEKSKLVGMDNMKKTTSHADHAKFSKALEGFDMVEVTNEFNALRRIKSPFELEAIQQNCAILDALLDVFCDFARIGARYWEVCAATEVFVKGNGAFWGRTKLSLENTPSPVPTARSSRGKKMTSSNSRSSTNWRGATCSR